MKKILLLAAFVLTLCGAVLAGCAPDHEEGSRMYRIYVRKQEHVTVTVPEEAMEGETVTIGVMPENGYWLDKVTINDQAVSSLTFVMPGYDVLIKAEVLNGSEQYPVSGETYAEGVLLPQVSAAGIGDSVTVYAQAQEGYRLSGIFANGIPLPFTQERDGYYTTGTIMQKGGLVFTAEFVPIERITEEYTLRLASAAGGAVSHWKAEYLEDGIAFSVLVEDETFVDTADVAVYNSDNVEFQICAASTKQLNYETYVLRCLVNAGGRFFLQIADTASEYADHGQDVGFEYGKNFTAESVRCSDEKNGFDGYAVHVFLGYDLFGLTAAEAYGNLTFVPAIRDTTSYDYRTGNLSTTWNSMRTYTLSRTTMQAFFSDSYKAVWGNPATFLGIGEDGTIYSRFLESYRDTQYLILGDSYMDERFWGLYREDMRDVFSCNIGAGGSHVSDWNNRTALSLVGEISPENILVHIGLNDVNVGGFSAEEAAQRIISFLNGLHGVVPDATVYWLALEPNVNRAASYETLYCAVNAAVAEFSSGSEFLKIIDAGALFLDGSGAPVPSLYSDGLHFSSFGYSLYVNFIRSAMGLAPLSDGTRFGNAKTGAATSGWTETEKNGETVLLQSGSIATYSDRYLYFKNFYGTDFTASARMSAVRVYNNDGAPKFGFILNDGEEQVLYYVNADQALNSKTVGYATRTNATVNGSFNWNSAVTRDVSFYYADGDEVELSVEKRGSTLKLYVNGFLVFATELTVCTGAVSVGFFSFNTELMIRGAQISAEEV